eukprot:SAG11_NODE_5354_length_1585_cov_2.418573_1_plen_84_part_10
MRKSKMHMLTGCACNARPQFKADLDTSTVELAQQVANGQRQQQQWASARLRALRCLQRLSSRPDSRAVFRDLDTDGDGTVSREE